MCVQTEMDYSLVANIQAELPANPKEINRYVLLKSQKPDQAFAFIALYLWKKWGEASVRRQKFLSSVTMQNVLPYFKESTPPHRRYILKTFLGSKKRQY